MSTKTILSVGVVFAVLTVVTSCHPVVWILGSAYGRVVDDVTGKAIPSAAVSTSWALHGSEQRNVGYLELDETTTDSNGDFHVASPGLRFHFSRGRLLRTQPVIRVIADDYLPAVARSSNDPRRAWIYLSPQNNGQVFRLKRAESAESYERALENFIDYFSYVRENWNCEWLRLPGTMKRVVRAREQLIKVGRGAGLPEAPPAPRTDCMKDLSQAKS
ncbi:MAG TPA: hypothetical protein VFU13_01130 [Steroidobacteraceae bacterium]|nr:hypothetical protein [Steroidobacteraceae bacterium]